MSFSIFVRLPSGKKVLSVSPIAGETMLELITRYASELNLPQGKYAIALRDGTNVTNEGASALEEDDVLIVTIAEAKGAWDSNHDDDDDDDYDDDDYDDDDDSIINATREVFLRLPSGKTSKTITAPAHASVIEALTPYMPQGSYAVANRNGDNISASRWDSVQHDDVLIVTVKEAKGA